MSETGAQFENVQQLLLLLLLLVVVVAPATPAHQGKM
jgi:hypothetical protein